MKKKFILNLVKYYSENNDIAFKNEVVLIAKEFDKAKDYELGEYLLALIRRTNVWIPQLNYADDYFKKCTKKQLLEEVKHLIVKIKQYEEIFENNNIKKGE